MIQLVIAIGLLGVFATVAQAAEPAVDVTPTLLTSTLPAIALAWLVPIGIMLVALGGVPQWHAREVALTGLAALGLAAIGYWAVGFAIQFGGIGLFDLSPDLQGLVWEWSALGPDWGPGWGMIGLAGWVLSGPAATPLAQLLFLSHLPWVTTAVLIPLLSLRGRTPTLVSLTAGALTASVLYPLAGNWVFGGGWLANLGLNLGLGHGAVDFASATAHLVGAMVALSGILIFCPRRVEEDEPELPPVHLPILAAAGAILVAAGQSGWLLANPLIQLPPAAVVRMVVNGLLAAAGGALAPLFYTWFVAGRHDALMTARGVVSGAIVVLAGAPFFPTWGALALGLAAGFVALLGGFVVDHVLRWDDPTAAVAVHALAAILALSAVGLLADGTVGAGWNGIGPDQYLAVPGQGVSGLWVASTMQPDWPGQLQAQLVGTVSIAVVSFALASIALAVVGLITRAFGASVPSLDDTEQDEALEPLSASESYPPL
ncbi:MAG: ammonium transporter [Anaerolineae bacterium]